METFGDRLRKYRTAHSLSASDLAYRVGVTEGAIRQIESGRTKSASFTLGLKLAKALGVEPWVLATGVGENDDARSESGGGSLKERVARLEARMDVLERDVIAPEVRRRSAGGRR
ncbi:MAG TPA: helix-turn-helix transcriptional regulator [Candidatus Elarobacter sp.]